MMIKTILIAFISLVSLLARAEYFQADLVTPNSDPQVGTHLIIVGKSIEFGDLWMAMGHGQALVFKDKLKHGNIRLISAIDNLDTFQERLKSWGYTHVQHIKKNMAESDVVSIIASTPKIASLDFLGHNGALKGIALENYDYRFFKSGVDELKKYKSHFTSDSYIRISACNTGWNLAPYMAEVLGVPVSGTLTTDGIQALYAPSVWYFDTNHPNVAALKYNSISYKEPMNCASRAGCRRLKPILTAYSGKHGTYVGTLPFAKYFCGSMTIQDCSRRAALSIITEFSSTAISDQPSLAQYSAGVVDLMCPGYNNLADKLKCKKIVIDHLSGVKSVAPTYSPIEQPLVNCTFKKCKFKTVDDGQGHFVMVSDLTQASTAFYDELNFYKLGFSLL